MITVDSSPVRPFATTYAPSLVRLLESIDNADRWMSGVALTLLCGIALIGSALKEAVWKEGRVDRDKFWRRTVWGVILLLAGLAILLVLPKFI